MQAKKLISFALSIMLLLSCLVTASAAPTWTGRFSDAAGYTNGYVGENYAITTFKGYSNNTNYNTMISGMRAKYPDAEIYLMSFPYYQNGLITSYCDIIEETAATYNCTFVNLYRDAGINSSNVSNYMVDGFLHPNYAGMDQITEYLVNAMLAE